MFLSYLLIKYWSLSSFLRLKIQNFTWNSLKSTRDTFKCFLRSTKREEETLEIPGKVGRNSVCWSIDPFFLRGISRVFTCPTRYFVRRVKSKGQSKNYVAPATNRRSTYIYRKNSANFDSVNDKNVLLWLGCRENSCLAPECNKRLRI